MPRSKSPHRICKRVTCRAPLSMHEAGTLCCPNGHEPCDTFTDYAKQQPNRASGSWSEVEVELLHELQRRLERGGDVRGLMRLPAWASVARRVKAMRDSIARRKAEATSKGKEQVEAAE